jgi:CPA2 family monovalent cation:H+ antiporter-2
MNAFILAAAEQSHDFPLLQDLAIILSVAGLVTLLCHWLKQPVVLGYLIAGVIVGPFTPPFNLVTDIKSIQHFQELGVIMLMFALGLHFSLRKLAKVGAAALIAAGMEIVIMVAAGYGLGLAFGWSPLDSLFLGAILSISSTTIIIKAFQELRLTKAPFAHVVFGILIVEDILGIGMLALLSGILSKGSLQAGDVFLTLGKLALFLTVILVAGLICVPPLIRSVNRFKSPEMLLVVVLALCFGVSLVALKLGYSVALGAFLIGAIVAETREHAKIEILIEPVRDMFAAVFFVAIGMLIDPKVLRDYAIPITIITAVTVVGKVFACGLGAFVAGNDRKVSLRIGMSLAQIGEFSFIIAALVKAKSPFLYPIAVAVSAITTLLTPYLIRSSDSVVGIMERMLPRSVTSHVDVYTQWVARLSRPASTTPQIRKIFIRWGIQLALNFALLTALLVITAWVGKLDAVAQYKLPAWTGGPKAVVWLAGTFLALPLLIAMLRKLRAVAMAVGELSVSKAAAKEKAAPLRAIIANTILSVGIFLLLIWSLALTSAILPPWPVLVTLLLIICGLGALMWGSFVKVYARAQIQLHEAFADHPPLAAEIDAIPVLRGAQLRAIVLAAGAPAEGKLIREVAIRSATGASIVAIERGAEPLLNPGPDEELRAGDQVYLLGLPEQVARAESIFGGKPSESPKSAAH